MIALLDGIADRTPVQANRVLSAIRKLFNWSVSRDIIQTSPCYLVEAPTKEVKRDRVLEDVELFAIWRACDSLGYPFGAFFRLALVTGQRRAEIATMRWSDIEGDLWTLPRESTKSNRAHTVPLSPLALEILASLPRYEDGDFVFSGTEGKKSISGFSRAKSRLDVDSKVAEWRTHDLRRSAATHMSRLGIDRLVISKILNHADQTVTAIHDRHEFDDQKRHALGTWARKLQSLTDPDADDGKVVPLASDEAG